MKALTARPEGVATEPAAVADGMLVGTVLRRRADDLIVWPEG